MGAKEGRKGHRKVENQRPTEGEKKNWEPKARLATYEAPAPSPDGKTATTVQGFVTMKGGFDESSIAMKDR